MKSLLRNLIYPQVSYFQRSENREASMKGLNLGDKTLSHSYFYQASSSKQSTRLKSNFSLEYNSLLYTMFMPESPIRFSKRASYQSNHTKFTAIHNSSPVKKCPLTYICHAQLRPVSKEQSADRAQNPALVIPSDLNPL
jgi:hypothetical protein